MDLKTKIEKKLQKNKDKKVSTPEEVEKQSKIQRLLERLKKNAERASETLTPVEMNAQRLKRKKKKKMMKMKNSKSKETISGENPATKPDEQDGNETNVKRPSEKVEQKMDGSHTESLNQSNEPDGEITGDFDKGGVDGWRELSENKNHKYARRELNGPYNRDVRGSRANQNKFAKKGKWNQRGGKHRGLMDLPEEVEERLVKLRHELFRKKLDIEEIKQILRKERRKAENEFKGILKTACYRCRRPGHKLSECPEVQDDMDNMLDVCYKCGSAEHRLYECKSNKTVLEYVSCFICKEKGHLSKACPQNTRGVYPKGGSCKICESIDHLAKDCPNLVKDGEVPEKEMTLGTMDTMESADAEILGEYEHGLKRKPKVVNF